jgi:RhoGAP domain
MTVRAVQTYSTANSNFAAALLHCILRYTRTACSTANTTYCCYCYCYCYCYIHTLNRELPEPLIPPEHYRALLAAAVAPRTTNTTGNSTPGASPSATSSATLSASRAAADAVFIEVTRQAVAQFPPLNATCTRLLFAFLHRVNLCSADNKVCTIVYSTVPVIACLR